MSIQFIYIFPIDVFTLYKKQCWFSHFTVLYPSLFQFLSKQKIPTCCLNHKKQQMGICITYLIIHYSVSVSVLKKQVLYTADLKFHAKAVLLTSIIAASPFPAAQWSLKSSSHTQWRYRSGFSPDSLLHIICDVTFAL